MYERSVSLRSEWMDERPFNFPCRRPRGDDSPPQAPGAPSKRRRVEAPACCGEWARAIHDFLETHAASRSADAEAAHYEAYTVLRACWRYCGRPQDTFESTRRLSPAAQRLLLTHGGHALTGDGKHIVVRGSSFMPRVGFLLTALRRRLFPGPSPACPAQWGAAWRAASMDCAHIARRGEALDVGAAQASLCALCNGAPRCLALLGQCEALGTEGFAARLAAALRAECFAAQDSVRGRGLAALVGAQSAEEGAEEDSHAVGAGERHAGGVVAHAVLLSPAGPLVVHAHSVRGRGIAAGAGDDEAELAAWLGEMVAAPQPTMIVEWGAHGALEQLANAGGGARLAAFRQWRMPRGPVVRCRGMSVELMEERPLAVGLVCHTWEMRLE